MLWHTKYTGLQRIYCNLFPAKPLYGSHQLDPVMIWPQGIDNEAFAVSLETVWYARVLILFSASAKTDTGYSPSTVHLFRRWKHTTILKMVTICVKYIIYIIYYIYIIMYIKPIILFWQNEWSRLDPRFYTCLTTESLYFMSSL